MGDLGVQVSLCSSFRQHLPWCLVQFYIDHFETLHVFSPWYEDVHVVWI